MVRNWLRCGLGTWLICGCSSDMLYLNHDCVHNSVIRVGLTVRGRNHGMFLRRWWSMEYKNESEKGMVVPVYGIFKLRRNGFLVLSGHCWCIEYKNSQNGENNSIYVT